MSSISRSIEAWTGGSETGGHLSTEVDLWPGVRDPAQLLAAIADWLIGYANHATRRTYAEGLGLPVSASDLDTWTRTGTPATGWDEALHAYSAALRIGTGPAPARTAPPPAPRGRLRTLHWFRWCVATAVDPLAATSTDVKTWLDELTTTGAAPATRDRMLATVKALYAYLASVKLATGNPAALDRRRLGLAVGATSTSTTVTLTANQVHALYTAAGAARRGASPLDTSRAMAVVALFTLGLRVSELCGLDRTDSHVTRGRRALRVLGKGGKTRIVYLSAPAESALMAYLVKRDEAAASRTTSIARRPANPLAAGPVPLLVTRTGNRYQRQAIWQLLRRLTAAAGPALADIVDAMHPHALRHFYVTSAVEAGAQLVHVQADVGHASIDTTQQTYDHAARDPSRSAVDLVAATWYTGVETGL
ncbi:tyrosine-type recombinase/integrase [Amycolatopsis sp. H20-H5]|uniref:tyrosine-type recombinase/integrase n=1 Tax=Amycolatopsis sp. H20-H5 TaxID=3046309 RepID=UPI002DB96C43|nr:tyrosine-type recombinase/integrase [Amycolatopsis sp. H20-H5]